MLLDRKKIAIKRLPQHEHDYPEIKDPSIVKVGNKWVMYVSIGSSKTQKWIVGRFESFTLDGVWEELPAVEFKGLSGPQMCAPAVVYRQFPESLWTMYIQTACFEENGVIASASSKDGQLFTGVSASLLKSEMVKGAPHKIVGLYDAGISEVFWEGKKLSLMLFSGYRSIGNGDLYLVQKPAEASDAAWSEPKLILSQEEVPFHNQPGSADYEWGLEGAKVAQLSPDCYMLIGVCFASLPSSYLGHRQRVFLASSKTPFGPFTPIGVPFLPIALDVRSGEQGHPDSVIEGNELWLVYQERKDNQSPWYLCYAKIDLHAFAMKFAMPNRNNGISPYYFDISPSLPA